MKYTNIVTTAAFGKASGAVNVGSTLQGMKKGDILIMDADTGLVLTGTGNTVTSNPNIAIVSCMKDGSPIISAAIQGKTLGEAVYKAHIARKIGNLVVGFKTGVSTETIPTYSEDTEFQMAVIIPTSTRLHPNKQYRKTVSAVGLGGYDVASALCKQLSDLSDNNPQLPANFPVVADVIVDGTSAAVATTSVTATNGSAQLVGTIGALAVGDVIRLTGTSDSGAGEDVTGKGGAFKIVAVGSGYVTLDRKYWGITTSGEEVSKYSTQLKTGITLFPREALQQENPVNKYNQVGKFQVALNAAFGDLSPVSETAPVLGEGYGWQMYDLESACMGNLGFTDRRDAMRQGYVYQSSVDAKYGQLAITSEKGFNTGNSSKSYASGGIVVGFNTAASTQRTAVSAILTPWLRSGGISVANTTW